MWESILSRTSIKSPESGKAISVICCEQNVTYLIYSVQHNGGVTKQVMSVI